MQSMRIIISFFIQVQIRLYDITCSIRTHASVIDRQPYSIVRHMGIGKEKKKIFFVQQTRTYTRVISFFF
jgi:hypothetical protein